MVLALAWSVTRQEEEIDLLRSALLSVVDGGDPAEVSQVIERSRAGFTIIFRSRVAFVGETAYCHSPP